MRNKYLKTDDVAVCFFGDGAANEGLFPWMFKYGFYLEIACYFVNENNLFAESTPQWYSSASATIAERALAYDMPGVRVNGKDLFAVYQMAKKLLNVLDLVKGQLWLKLLPPWSWSLWRGWTKYKAPDGEEKDWADVDPLEVFRNYTIEHELLTEEELDEILEESKKDVDDAIKYAQDSPILKAESLLEDVFAE